MSKFANTLDLDNQYTFNFVNQEDKCDDNPDESIVEIPMIWDSTFENGEQPFVDNADTISDGLILSIHNLGKVDIEYISKITGFDCKTIISELKGVIYQNPAKWEGDINKGWETSEEYLSGNLVRKLRCAQEANVQYDGYFNENIKAIEKVLPPSVNTEDIYVTLGTPWIPEEYIFDFINHFICNDVDKWGGYCEIYNQVVHNKITGVWKLYCFHYNYAKNFFSYGTKKISAIDIIEASLNMKTVAVYDSIEDSSTGKKKRVLNKQETILAIDKQNLLIKEFQNWIWTEKDRKSRLENIYYDNFCCYRTRKFNGSFLQFPNLSNEFELYPYQKDAVAKILFSSNTLLAHDVGAGKTLVMIAAGMELRRMGLSKKNMYVVPNNIIGQWENTFKSMYPNANILCVSPKSFVPNKRKKVISLMKENDYDGIIIAYSCFEQIHLSKDYYMKNLEQEISLINSIIDKKNQLVPGLSRKLQNLKKSLFELSTELVEENDDIYFDELGINRLFVDEAHNYKNLSFETKMDNIRGINSKGAKKCNDMLDKVRVVQKQNNGAGVIFATGTPITNSIADAFVMQKYLQNGELSLLEIQNFDSWVGAFVEKDDEFEVDVDTSQYRIITRLSKLHNIPELTTILADIADFHQMDTFANIPKFDNYTDVLVKKNNNLSAYLSNISDRAFKVRQRLVSRSEDNMLKITTDGRKAALDMRLIDPNSLSYEDDKVSVCVDNIAEIYKKTLDKKSTQLVFCDISTPKKGFNIYEAVKQQLVGMGIPDKEIAFIHDAESDAEKNKLFEQVRNGEIRILIGSTPKLGQGVNVQDKLIAIHHLDVPWRPSDMTQREGRILRQGNSNEKVYIYRYITEGSFDAYSWQLLETKQRFITGLLSGFISERSGKDIGDTILDYVEVKALSIGNLLIKERVETANELMKKLAIQKKYIETRLDIESQLNELPDKIRKQKVRISNCQKDIEDYDSWKDKYLSNMDENKKAEMAKQRKEARQKLLSSIYANTLSTCKNNIMEYRGFEVILPANVSVEKPYVWLKRNGLYAVELGKSEIGNLTRIDNFLNSLNAYKDELIENLNRSISNQVSLKEELGKKSSLADEIELCKERLKQIDQKLGV